MRTFLLFFVCFLQFHAMLSLEFSECLGDRQFVVSDESAGAFSTVVSTCVDLINGTEGQLALIKDQETFDFVNSFFSDKILWIGLSRVGGGNTSFEVTDPRRFVFLDGTPIVDGGFASINGVLPWGEGLPDDAGFLDEECVGMILGEFNDRGCVIPTEPLCEFECLTDSPTLNPTISPTVNPTLNPTTSPTQNPTQNPTKSPTFNPTAAPTGSPSQNPTVQPTSNPTVEVISLADEILDTLGPLGLGLIGGNFVFLVLCIVFGVNYYKQRKKKLRILEAETGDGRVTSTLDTLYEQDI